MACCSCKNLDTKKKINGAVSGTSYMCKKHKAYVLGCNSECDKFVKANRPAADCDKLYFEGKDWDNDRTSPGVYFAAAIILLIILLFVFLFNCNLFGF